MNFYALKPQLFSLNISTCQSWCGPAAPWWRLLSCSSDMSGASNTLAREFLTDVHQLCSAVAQRAEARDEDEEESHMVALGEYLVRGRGFLLLSTLDSIIDQVWAVVVTVTMMMLRVQTIDVMKAFSYKSSQCNWYDLPVGRAHWYHQCIVHIFISPAGVALITKEEMRLTAYTCLYLLPHTTSIHSIFGSYFHKGPACDKHYWLIYPTELRNIWKY